MTTTNESHQYTIKVSLWYEDGVLFGDDHEMPQWLDQIVNGNDCTLFLFCTMNYWEDSGDYETPPMCETEYLCDAMLKFTGDDQRKICLTDEQSGELQEIFQEEIESYD